MALALYRRYRPDTFDGIIGQSQVTVPLSRALDEGRLTHAYLFSGPRGCGKTSSARILARCINCVKGPTSHPCGECESCRDLATGGPGSLDVVEIDAASHNGVEDARELRERASFAPSRDRYKIFILDEAHMVTQQGFNALLKIVEEPPEHVMFIFATTEPDKVIGTIRSRTHHYPFRLVPPEVMGPYLEQVCEQEGIEPEPGVLGLAMRAGGGSVRDTLSVLDQLMVGAVDNEISYDSAVALLGFTPDELIGEAVDAVAEGDGTKLYGVVQKVVVGGFEPRRFVEDLLSRVRDLLVLTLAGGQAEGALSDDSALQNIDDLKRQAQAFGLAKLTWMAHTINTALEQMNGTTSPRLRLELLAASLLAGEPEAAGAVAANGTAAEVQASGAAQVPGRSAAGGITASTGFIGSRRNRSAAANPVAPVQFAGPAGGAPVGASASPVAQAGQSAQAGDDAHGSHSEQAAQTSSRTGQANADGQVGQSDHDNTGPTSEAQLAGPSRPDQGGRPAQTSAMADPDQGWQEVLASLSEDIRAYVSRDKVPTVSFQAFPNGNARLSMTFDSALSQHAFALAVADDGEHHGQKASKVVLNAVREVFGQKTMIAPTGTAANGEQVVSTNRMKPEELAQVKRRIAMAKAGVADVGASVLSAHTGSEPKAQKSGDSGKGDGDGDDSSHRAPASDASVAESPSTEAKAGPGESGLSQAKVSDPEDDDYDPWLQPSGSLAPRSASVGSTSEPANERDGTAGDVSVAELNGHGGKKVAVPDISDGIDPWAVDAVDDTAVAAGDMVSQTGSAVNAGSAAGSNVLVQAGNGERTTTGGQLQADDRFSAREAGRGAEHGVSATADVNGSDASGSGYDRDGGGKPKTDGEASVADRFAAEPGMEEDMHPQVSAEEDEYSIDDRSLGQVTALSVEELSKLFDVKKVEEFAVDDPRNPINQKPSDRHQEESR
jgi:DNA polymerase III subunit gamma/tau